MSIIRFLKSTLNLKTLNKVFCDYYQLKHRKFSGHNNLNMGTVVEKRADCTPCRLVGSLGLVGIGAYLANAAFKNKTVPGKVVVSTISFVFVTLGVQRYKQQFPFNKNVQKS